MLDGEAVPAAQKIVSLVEPHTAIVRKGKPGRPTEFGRVLWLGEVEGGLITRYEVLDGNPPAADHVPRSLAHQRRVFKCPPHVLTGDRGVHSPANEHDSTAQGVRRVMLPQPGAKSAKRLAHERQRWFRRGHDWRSGMAGPISGLKRLHKLDRCRNHGEAGMERRVGWGVIAHDLRTIARALAQ